MSIIGYARVSSVGQSLEVQQQLLEEAGCEKTFSEKRGGSSTTGRDQLALAVDYLRDGDVIHFKFESSKIFPGTNRDVWVYVPKQHDGKTPACVHVNQDGVQFGAVRLNRDRSAAAGPACDPACRRSPDKVSPLGRVKVTRSGASSIVRSSANG